MEKMPHKFINHLLLVDDDPLTEVLIDGISGNLHLINRYVFKPGGKQALDYLSFCNKTSDFPDLIIVDLRMPEMDGFEFIENYESSFYHTYPETKLVIATNSMTEQGEVLMDRFPSVKMFILKPIVKDRFINIYHSLYSS